MRSEITYRERAPIDADAYGRLMSVVWGDQQPVLDIAALETHALTWVTAHDGQRLVGFAKAVWDGGAHAFLLDPTVDSDYRRRGIATEMVARIAAAATRAGVTWLHVDHTPDLAPFYARCGFAPSAAGVMRLGTA